MEKEAYYLKLVSGPSWQIVADEESSWLSRRLARVARLRSVPAKSDQTLTIIKNGRNQGLQYCLEACSRAHSGETLPDRDWSPNTLRLVEFWSHPEAGHVICHLKDWEDSWPLRVSQIQQSLYPVVMGVIRSGGLPMHAALLEKDGKGILISAKGGTGKSTCSRRVPPPWRALCDDACIIGVDAENGYRVHPFPTWKDHLNENSDRTWNVQEHVPLSGIFFLRQAAVDEVVKLGKGEAASNIYSFAAEANATYEVDQGPDFKKELRRKMLDNACRIAETTPAYTLKATLTGQFWLEIEKAMNMV